jgi:glycosyltransferase involved in cell wall biosynthesis
MDNRRPWLKILSFRLIESRILRHAALVHYTSEQERSEAQALQATPASVVIPNPVTQEVRRENIGRFRKQFPQLQGRRMVLFLSRLDEKKGLDILLRAFADVAVRVPDASLVLAAMASPSSLLT